MSRMASTNVPGNGEGNSNSLQCSCLENPMDGGAWRAAVHGVAECRTRLNDFTFTFHFHALEKEMATHSSVLAWRIPGTGEPGGLPSTGSHRVGSDWSDLAAMCLAETAGLSWDAGAGACFSFPLPLYNFYLYLYFSISTQTQCVSSSYMLSI